MIEQSNYKRLKVFGQLMLGKAARLLTQNVDGSYSDLNIQQLTALDVTAGAGVANKAVVLDASGNFVMPATGMFATSRAVIAAAGTTQATATVVATQNVAVTASDGVKGVALPSASTATGPITITNTVANQTLLVYPVNGGDDLINALSANAAYTQTAGSSVTYTPYSATQWYATNGSNAATGKFEVEAGAGITGGVGAIYRSMVERTGGIIRSTIAIDLTGLASSTTDLDIIGVGASVAHLGQMTAARNGTNLSCRMICLEVPAGGVADIDFYYATEGTGVFDSLITALTETAIITAGGAWTLALMKAAASGVEIPANAYLYLTCGAGGTAATYTAGKFEIIFTGY